MTIPQKSTESKKNTLYEDIAKKCDNLPIARYLKNEAKNSLKYLTYNKLSNVKKNIDEFLEYLMFINEENCKKIESLSYWWKIKKDLNNSLSYFYHNDEIHDWDLTIIQNKIETNTYETITLMQSIKWCLILTIDEFCNASPTRIDLIRYDLWKKKSKVNAKEKIE